VIVTVKIEVEIWVDDEEWTAHREDIGWWQDAAERSLSENNGFHMGDISARPDAKLESADEPIGPGDAKARGWEDET